MTPPPVQLPPLAIGAITDEFSPDLERALPAMAALGMTAAELRVIDGTNVVDLGDPDIDRIASRIAEHGMRIVSIASPVLKCALPDAPPLDERFQKDVFASKHTFADQPALARRAFAIARRTGAPVVRVFTYWRTTDPDRCFDRIVTALRELGDQAAADAITVGVENEHACNVGTGAELARLLEAVDHPSVRAVWDPANALVAGESPFPSGYRAVGAARIVHVHAKDCRVTGHTPTWGLLGDMDVDWRGQIEALHADGYRGAMTLETHWTGPHGDKLEASRLCGERLRAFVNDARASRQR